MGGSVFDSRAVSLRGGDWYLMDGRGNVGGVVMRVLYDRGGMERAGGGVQRAIFVGRALFFLPFLSHSFVGGIW